MCIICNLTGSNLIYTLHYGYVLPQLLRKMQYMRQFFENHTLTMWLIQRGWFTEGMEIVQSEGYFFYITFPLFGVIQTFQGSSFTFLLCILIWGFWSYFQCFFMYRYITNYTFSKHCIMHSVCIQTWFSSVPLTLYKRILRRWIVDISKCLCCSWQINCGKSNCILAAKVFFSFTCVTKWCRECSKGIQNAKHWKCSCFCECSLAQLCVSKRSCKMCV